MDSLRRLGFRSWPNRVFGELEAEDGDGDGDCCGVVGRELEYEEDELDPAPSTAFPESPNVTLVGIVIEVDIELEDSEACG